MKIKNSIIYYQCFILVMLLFQQCNTKPGLPSDSNQELKASVDPIQLSVFGDSLNRLSAEIRSTQRALQIFDLYFDKTEPEHCDQALKDFLNFQARITDDLNSKLYDNPDFEKLNSITWADQSLHDSLGISFEQDLNHHGWVLRSTEGTIYIARNTGPIRKTFFEYLSPSTQEFFNQFEFEENQVLSEDGGLIIRVEELADRLGFWEVFMSENSGHLFEDFASENIKYYRYYMLEGMDNTPAFDRFESKLINTEFEQAMEHYIAKYPQTQSAIIFNSFMKLLRQEKQQYTPSVEAFIEQYKPWD
jgi:hypothetical protein